MNASQIGAIVARARRRAGLSQVELARRIQTTQAAISKVETGRSLPTIPLLERIARATGEPIVLVLGEREQTPTRAERRARVRRVLGDHVFDPWDRDPSSAERESLLADGLTRERFAR